MSVLSKAGYDVVIPNGISDHCCGLIFDSRGYPKQGSTQMAKLEEVPCPVLACPDAPDPACLRSRSWRGEGHVLRRTCASLPHTTQRVFSGHGSPAAMLSLQFSTEISALPALLTCKSLSVPNHQLLLLRRDSARTLLFCCHGFAVPHLNSYA